MEPLGRLLGKLRKSLGDDSQQKEVIISCIKEVLGFEIRTQDISIRSGNLYIKTSPVKRSEINLRQNEILALINQRTKLNLKKILY